MMVGNVALAQVFSPNEDMAKAITEPVRFMVHNNCMSSMPTLFLSAIEEQTP